MGVIDDQARIKDMMSKQANSRWADGLPNYDRADPNWRGEGVEPGIGDEKNVILPENPFLKNQKLPDDADIEKLKKLGEG